MHLTRRNFLVVAGVGAAALALPGCGSSSSGPSPSLSLPTGLGVPPVAYLPTTGAPAYPSSVKTAQEASQIALAMARTALAQKTFAVGGVIVENSTGRVITAMHNNVIRQLPNLPTSAFTWDPTAHGERQLVSWYYANVEQLKLPPPPQLTIVTSLDPCAQCAGSLMTAGFNVAVIAYDETAGVNYNLKNNYLGLPERFRAQAKQTFGYYAIAGGRAYSGTTSAVFAGSQISKATALGCLSAFDKSRAVVASVRTTTNAVPADMTDPAGLPADSPVRKQLTNLFPQAFTLRLPDYRSPNAALQQMLQQVKDATPGAQNAVALIDPFGNLVALAPDTFDVSPIATGFMNVVEGFSQARFDLAADPATNRLGGQTLTNPKYGTFVWLHAPSPNETTTIKDLGIYDLTIEGDIPVTAPSNFQYYLPPTSGTVAELKSMITTMAPWTTPADPAPVKY